MELSHEIRPAARQDPVASWYVFLLLAIVFGISYSQFPLYYFTQNQYFFHGLARAGFGLLRNDWLANTADSWPAFTLLVEFTYRYLDQRLFYLYYIALLGVYAYSVLGIASTIFRIDSSRPKYLAYLAIITALHSPALGYLSIRTLGFDLGRELVEGVASQRLLDEMLHPGAFGVFLLLSIHLFLRKRPYLSIVSSSVAALFHPSYVLIAGVLTCSYMIIMLRRGERLGEIFRLGVCSLVLMFPILVYAYLVFRPTSPDIWAQAQDVLVHSRLARHTIIARWLGGMVYAKVAVILAALYLIRRTQLFGIMLVFFVTAVGLTIIQVLSGSNTLALLFPWRFSVVLVPLSTALVLAYVVSGLFSAVDWRVPRIQGVVAALSVVALIALVGAGAMEMSRRFQSGVGREGAVPTGLGSVRRTYVVGLEAGGAMKFVRTTRSPGQTYLIPPDWRYFRLFTGAPAFVDYWFIPYNDVAVMEWHKRVQLADALYGASGDVRCRMMKELSAGYRVTHVVVGAGGASDCGGWKVLFQDDNYRLYGTTP